MIDKRADAEQRPTVPRAPFCLRLTFAYDRNQPDNGIRLIRVERIRATAPGLSTPPPRAGQGGAWFEVRGGEEQLLYYSVLHDPMPDTREVFADANGEPDLARVPSTQSHGEFSTLVPDLPLAKSLVFHAALAPAASGSRSGYPDVRRRAARELLRIPFQELRDRAAGKSPP
jgi:hypothetical protein